MSEQSGREEYAFLEVLTALIRPKHILEIGTAKGHATLALARGAGAGCEVVTVDIKDMRCEALKNPGELPASVQFVQDDSIRLLERLIKQGKCFDLVFIDGDHHFNQVSKDWRLAKQLSDTIILHDALQFNGVRRVVDEIRRDSEWDVSVLSYPGTTLFDPLTGKHYFSNRCPGIAIATRRKKILTLSHKQYLEHPSRNSRRAFARRKQKFREWHSSATQIQDLNFADWEIIFHMLWNLRPSVVLHLGHVGSGASLVLMEYAKAKKKIFLGLDPTARFWERKKSMLPEELKPSSQWNVLTGLQAMEQIESLILQHETPFLWIDEYNHQVFYNGPLRRILNSLPKKGTACIMNFSPYYGQPERRLVAGSECTNPSAFGFCEWISDQPFHIRQAVPEAVFGDYVNAGHWLVIQRLMNPLLALTEGGR